MPEFGRAVVAMPYNVRTHDCSAGGNDMAASTRPPHRARNARIELRTTDDQRDLIDRAAEMEGVDRTAFILRCSTEEAQRVLADRESFVLSPAQAEEWDLINSRPAVDVEGLRALFDRPSPFV